MLIVLLYCLYGTVAGAMVLAAWRLSYAKRHFRQKRFYTSASVIEDMPSVSVCIPARNESHAMTDALQRVIASTYPKLEIIVLDDLSADKTPALIKAFAHEGVRFVEGQPAPDGWLGKNHALDTLLKEASGAYILFLDVDTHLSPDSIEQLVAYATQESATMVSVLPRREDGLRASTVFAPLRYFWELMFHRREAPAVASSAWLLNRRQFVTDFDDFDKLKGVIQPEAHIAATYMAQDAYRFLIGSELLGISHEKKWQSQVDTSVRLLFPLLGMKVVSAVIAVIDLLLLAAPVWLVFFTIATGWSLHYIGAVMLYVGGVIIYGWYLHSLWYRTWWLAGILWPYAVFQEMILVIISTKQYLRGQVTWKGRLIKLPRRR